MVTLRKRAAARQVLSGMSWSVLPLVAGLFVLVEGLARSGVQAALAAQLESRAASSPAATAWLAGALVAFASNLVNNLPADLIAGAVVAGARVNQVVQGAVAIGIDLGPNLSVTGSLATILWLTAIRREGEDVSAWRFFKVGVLAMPLGLLAALGALSVQG